MTEIPEELLDAYSYEMSIAASSFKWMGKMLDDDYVKTRVNLLGAPEMFIYGGGYLGIQLYRAASRHIEIPAVVDRKGKLSVHALDIPVITAREFKGIYKGQKVVIASINFYCEIRRELSGTAPENQIVFLGEFIEGLLR